MLKGKIQIDLHNRNSGFTERYEQTNMVTNAVKYMLGNVMNMRQNPYNLFTPLSTHGLGGIFLFDGRLEENADNIHFPSSVHLVGHAGQSQDTTHPLRGSINVLESGRTETGYRSVWDFSTSQGNGTIASLALTHGQAGDFPFEYHTYQSLMSTSFLATPLAYDRWNHILYYRENANVFKTRIPSELVLVNDPYYGFTKEGADELVCTLELSKGTYSYWEAMNGYDGYVYLIYTPGNSSGDATLYVRRYKVDDFSFTAEDEQVITLRNIQLYSTSKAYNTRQYATASRGYYYLRAKDNHKFYIVEIANPTNIREVDFGDASYYGNLRENYGGGVAMQLTEPIATGTQRVSVFLYPDGRFINDHDCRTIYGSACLETDRLTAFHYYTSSGSSLRLAMTPWYLGSICNLASPVFKTPSTDMKITYTLTDVEGPE